MRNVILENNLKRACGKSLVRKKRKYGRKKMDGDMIEMGYTMILFQFTEYFLTVRKWKLIPRPLLLWRGKFIKPAYALRS